eukprot:2381347-Pleurochrysis_carterae.AAC.1
MQEESAAENSTASSAVLTASGVRTSSPHSLPPVNATPVGGSALRAGAKASLPPISSASAERNAPNEDGHPSNPPVAEDIRTTAMTATQDSTVNSAMKPSEAQGQTAAARGPAERSTIPVSETEEEGTEVSEVLSDAAKERARIKWRRKRGKGTTALVLIFLNAWIFFYVAACCFATAWDGHTVREIDYWYKVPLCRRGPDQSVPSFSEYKPLPVRDELACKAATSRSRCVGAACSYAGCTDTATGSPEACKICCNGVLEQLFEPCHFPFSLGTALHSTCLSGSDGTSWCPISNASGVVNGQLQPTERGRCKASCAQADYVSAPESCAGLAPSCPQSGTSPMPVELSIDRSGFDGETGIRYGADYHLVLFAYADYLEVDLELQSKTGRS